MSRTWKTRRLSEYNGGKKPCFTVRCGGDSTMQLIELAKQYIVPEFNEIVSKIQCSLRGR